MGFIFLFRFNNERERREILRRGMFILFLPCHFHTYYVQTVCADSNCSVTVRVGCGLISQVIDDILDEGHTLLAIVDHLKSEGAREVLTAVLVNKVHERKARPGQRADFSGLDVEDRYLFGCGMDYKGYWRNLPGIYALKES